jgi:hypothetical protein
MKPFLIATFMILGLGLGPTNKAQAQISYGYSVPLDDSVADSSGTTSSGGYYPGNYGYPGMMYTGGYYPGNYGYSGSMYPWGYSPWNSRYSRWSATGSSPSFTGATNQTWSNRWSGSNQWNGFGSGGGFSQSSMSMTPTSMNSGLGGMMNMGMRRR